VTVTAEDVTKEGELADLVRNKMYFLDNTRLDVCPKTEGGELETVVPVLATEFQCYWHAFLDRDLARFEFES
jgi:hypothetical protein